MENSPPGIQTIPVGAFPGGISLLGTVGTKREVVGEAAAVGGVVGSTGRVSAALVDEGTACAAEADCVDESFHMVMPIAATRTNVNIAIRFTLDLPESVGLAEFLPFDIRPLQPATIADGHHCGDAIPEGDGRWSLTSSNLDFADIISCVKQQLLSDFGTIN